MGTYNPNDFSPMSGKEINSQGNVVTPADGVNADGSQNVVVKRKTFTQNPAFSGTVNASSFGVQSSWMDCDGYSTISITLTNDASATSQVNIQWSNDGTNVHGQDYTVVASNTLSQKAGSTTLKARYAKVSVYNGDTASHVMNAWAYLIS